MCVRLGFQGLVEVGVQGLGYRLSGLSRVWSASNMGLAPHAADS